MSEHRYHESILDNGLADDCPGCAALAKYPFHNLDAGNFIMMWERTIAWMNDEVTARSDTEAMVMRKFEDHISQQQIVERRLAVTSK